MRRSIFILCMLLAGPASGASDVDSTRVERPGTAPLSQGLLLSRYAPRDPRDTPAPNYLTFSLGPFAMHPYVPATRFEAMLFGAGSAGTLAMFVGAIGNTLGAFDEDTTWILTGAAAAVGAIYSGSRYQVRATLYPEPWSIPSGPPRSP